MQSRLQVCFDRTILTHLVKYSSHSHYYTTHKLGTRYSIAKGVSISLRYLGSNNIEKTFSFSDGQTRGTEAGEVPLPILCSTTK